MELEIPPEIFGLPVTPVMKTNDVNNLVRKITNACYQGLPDNTESVVFRAIQDSIRNEVAEFQRRVDKIATDIRNAREVFSAVCTSNNIEECTVEQAARFGQAANEACATANLSENQRKLVLALYQLHKDDREKKARQKELADVLKPLLMETTKSFQDQIKNLQKELSEAKSHNKGKGPNQNPSPGQKSTTTNNTLQKKKKNKNKAKNGTGPAGPAAGSSSSNSSGSGPGPSHHH